MGSIAHLYTTGDNDPQIEPERYYRHYLYCDGCGSFDLEEWVVPENHAAIERTRGRLATAALLSLPMVAVPGWIAAGLPISPTFLVILVAGIILRLHLTDWITGMRRLAGVLVWLPGIAIAEVVASAFVSPWILLGAGLALVAGLLVWRARSASKVESLGLRCGACGATYRRGSAFFTDLEANPRGLTMDDVPRPLGVVRFEEGRSVGPAPQAPRSRLPG